MSTTSSALCSTNPFQQTMDHLRRSFPQTSGTESSKGKDLVAAVYKCKVDKVRAILEADPSTVHFDEEKSLRIAAELGYEEIVTLLLEYKADPNAVDNHALTYAVAGGNVRIIQALLDHGADPHAREDFPYWAAFYNGRENVANMLRARMIREPQRQVL